MYMQPIESDFEECPIGLDKTSCIEATDDSDQATSGSTRSSSARSEMKWDGVKLAFSPFPNEIVNVNERGFARRQKSHRVASKKISSASHERVESWPKVGADRL